MLFLKLYFYENYTIYSTFYADFRSVGMNKSHSYESTLVTIQKTTFVLVHVHCTVHVNDVIITAENSPTALALKCARLTCFAEYYIFAALFEKYR